MLTGSIITGGSSISLFMAPISEGGGGGGASEDRRDLSSLSWSMERNLLDLRGGLDADGVGGTSGDMDEALPLATLATLLAGSVTDLDLSRFACFWRNLGSLEDDWVGGTLEEGVVRDFRLDIRCWSVD
jgi:hypothetical protein